MKSVAAIFRKDARRLWPQIAIFWTMLALGVLFDPGRGDRALSQFRLFLLLLSLAQPLSCWTLLIAAIHEECLPGDQQYWLTRPFTWKELLLEKLLFTVVFVNVAVLVAQSVVLWRVGISPLAHLSALLWSQVFFSTMFLLPVAALAAVTRNFGQLVLAAFVVFVPFFGLLQLRAFVHQPGAWGNLDWIRDVVIALLIVSGVGAILLLQYSARRTMVSRVLIGVTALALISSAFIRRSWALPLRSLWPAGSESRIAVTLLDPSRAVARAYRGLEGSATFELPVQIDGLPAATELLPERFSARIDVPGSSPITAFANRFTVNGAQGQLSMYVSRGIYEYMKDKTVQISGVLEFSLLQGKEVLPAPGPEGEVVPGVGVCFPSVSRGLIGPPRLNIVCSTPFPKMAVFLAGEAGRPNWVIPPGSVNAPIPTDRGFDILDRFTSQISYSSQDELPALRLYTARPVAHSQLTYSFRDVRLADYLR